MIPPCKMGGVPTPRIERSSEGDAETKADRCSDNDSMPWWSKDDQRIVIWNDDVIRIYRHDFDIRLGNNHDLSVGPQVAIAHRLLPVPLNGIHDVGRLHQERISQFLRPRHIRR